MAGSIAERILEPYVHRSGDTVLLPNAAPVTVEFEIAYILGPDILPGEPEVASIATDHLPVGLAGAPGRRVLRAAAA